jgi:hypothetical protein
VAVLRARTGPGGTVAAPGPPAPLVLGVVPACLLAAGAPHRDREQALLAAYQAEDAAAGGGAG